PTPAHIEPPAPVIVAPPTPAVVPPAVEPSPAAVVPPVVEPPAAASQRQQRAVIRKPRRPPVPEEPVATATVPRDEAETAVPPPTEGGDAPVAIVRGGAARPLPGARAPGPRIIQVDPHDGAR